MARGAGPGAGSYGPVPTLAYVIVFAETVRPAIERRGGKPGMGFATGEQAEPQFQAPLTAVALNGGKKVESRRLLIALPANRKLTHK